MDKSGYPEMISSLPEADVPIPGVLGKLLQAKDHQVVFWNLDTDVVIPPHSHRDQWGIVVDGEIVLTIGDETRRCRAGDSFFVPAGVEHGVTVVLPSRVIDVFADVDRFTTR